MMTLDELKAQRAKLDEQIAAAEKAAQYPWSVGPWKVWSDGAIGNPYIRNIAKVNGCGEQEKANARLIAAAPELFMMLEEITAEYKGLLESDYNTAERAAYINKAEQLLARIRGG